MQVSILSGIYAKGVDLRVARPINLRPVPRENGISSGYLRPCDGIESFATGQGGDRGGIEWNGVCYRVSGTKLLRVNADGSTVILGDVGPGGRVSMDYSFDRLAIASGGRLYYMQGGGVTQVTDPDLGAANHVVWVDGYFMTTDGTSLVVTELNNPAAVDPLKYGSAEADPDPIQQLIKRRREVYAVGRHSIEVFANVGGAGFPFQRIDSAHIPRGAIGKQASAWYLDSVAFVGSGRDEPPAVWLAQNGGTSKISDEDIDRALAEVDPSDLQNVVVESRLFDGRAELLIHLPDCCLVYDAQASEAFQRPAWYRLSSAVTGCSAYKARDFVWCYGKWICGDPTSASIGALTGSVSSQWGSVVGWEAMSPIIYLDAASAIVHELELIAITGNAQIGADPVVWASHSFDGVTWSVERATRAGSQGQRGQRIAWRRQGVLRNGRVQRFRGTSDAHISLLRFEIQAEPLNV